MQKQRLSHNHEERIIGNMNDMFKKLNVLVKSSLNDLLGDVTHPRFRIAPEHLGKDVDREIAMLRGKINEAVEYEGQLQARVQQLQDEVARWDQQADAAVAAQDDVQARYAIEQMKRAEQRLAIADADLQDHRYVVQELITRVNTLEAAVADARRAQQAQSEKSAESAGAEEKAAPAKPLPGRLLSDVLKDARETITSMGEMLAAKDEVNPPPAPAEPKPEGVESDLERRRKRLSK